MHAGKHSSIADNPRNLRYFMASSEAFVTMSILVAFFEYKQVVFQEFLWIQSIFSLALLLLEVPSGYLSDRFSRKTVLIYGALLIFLGNLGILLGYGFWQLAASEIVMAAGRSLISGTSSAMLYDGLLAEGKEASYSHEEGTIKSWMAYALAGAGLAGGFLYTLHPELPQALTCAMLFCSVFFALRLVEAPIHEAHPPESPIREMRRFVHYALRGHAELPVLIFYSGLICGGTMLGTWLTQPYWQAVGMPIWSFGVLFFLMQAIRGGCLARATSLLLRVDRRKVAFVLMAALCCGFFLQAVVTHPAGIILTAFPAAIYGFSHILILGQINQRVESRMRATVLSIESLMWRMVFALMAPIIGFVQETAGLQSAFAACGVTWLALGLPLCRAMWKKAL